MSELENKDIEATVAKAEEKEEEEESGGIRGFLEDSTESILFASRWLLAPVYLGLVLALGIVTVKFFQRLWEFVRECLEMNVEEVAIHILSLLDVALLANLLLIVIFSGYENFVSKINPAVGHEDRPSWMGHLDFSGLKIKIVGSIVAISLIELLQDFLHASEGVTTHLLWRVILHLTFVVSGLLFAVMDYVAEKRAEIDPIAPHNRAKHEKAHE
jgi:uncharacterized protein (TIGR00645 family)